MSSSRHFSPSIHSQSQLAKFQTEKDKTSDISVSEISLYLSSFLRKKSLRAYRTSVIKLSEASRDSCRTVHVKQTKCDQSTGGRGEVKGLSEESFQCQSLVAGRKMSARL